MFFDPYQQCPTFQSQQFLLRLITPQDTQDLLFCYADPLAAPIFNSDNCTSDFIYNTLEEMQECITFWLDSYAKGHFIRFSIVDLSTQKAVGTIECFAKPDPYENFGEVAVLRLDIASTYENTTTISELLQLVEDHFYECFDVNTMVTKAVPLAQARICVLSDMGYEKLDPNPIMSFADYYAKIRSTNNQ